MKETGCTCDRCGDTYKIDLNLPNELWWKINPVTYKMLCPECIGELLKWINEFGAYHLQSQVVDDVPSDSHPKITLGSYTIQQMPSNPLKIWIEDVMTGERGEFDKVGLHYAIHKFYKGNF